jgi:hypothetical protein
VQKDVSVANSPAFLANLNVATLTADTAVFTLAALFQASKLVHQHAQPLGQLRLNKAAGFFSQLAAYFF